MEEFLKELGITDEGNYDKDGCYVIDIPDDKTYGKYFSILSKSDLVDEEGSSSQLTDTVSSLQYEGDDYLITLMSDYEEDIYRLTVKEI